MRRNKKRSSVFALAVVIALIMNSLGMAVFAEDSASIWAYDDSISQLDNLEQTEEGVFEGGNVGGLDVHTYNYDGNISVTVETVDSEDVGVDLNIQGDGDVTVGTDSVEGATGGVSIYGMGDGEILLTTGDIHTSGDDDRGSAGIYINNYSNEITVETGTVTSDTTPGAIILSSNEEGLTEVNVTTDSISGTDGLVIEAGVATEAVEPGNIIVEVNGDVTGTKRAGAVVESYGGEESSAQLTVNGNVEGQDEGLHVDNAAYKPGWEGNVTVEVNGDVAASMQADDSTGMYAKSSGGKIDVSVDGSVEGSTGIEVSLVNTGVGGSIDLESQWTELSNIDDVDGYAVFWEDDDNGYYEDDNGNKVLITWNEEKHKYTDADGNVLSFGWYIDDDENFVYEFVLKDSGESDSGNSGNTSCINIAVTGDVTGSEFGLRAGEGGLWGGPVESEGLLPSTLVADILVAETLSGDTVSVALDNTVTSDNLQLTVWAVEINTNGNVAETIGTETDETEATEASKAFEQAIRYIIKVEPLSEGGTLSAADAEGNDLETSHDYDIAYEGDKVILKVELEKGYKLVAAYNGKGEKVKLLTDAEGNYYVEVPKGGGVYLSAEVEKEKYDISYDLDGGVYNGATDTVVVNCEYGSVISILDAPTKEGFKFLYWKGSEYNPGDSYTVEGAHKFTAIWELVEEKSEEPTVTPDPTPADYVAPTPKTGDSSGIGAWIMLMTVSGLAAAEMFIFRKRFSE